MNSYIELIESHINSIYVSTKQIYVVM